MRPKSLAIQLLLSFGCAVLVAPALSEDASCFCYRIGLSARTLLNQNLRCVRPTALFLFP
jgi:hypothetical protein